MADCWNGACVAGEHKDSLHLDATGHTWEQTRGTEYCPACRAFVAACDHTEPAARPASGHAVRLAAPWKWGRLAAGSVGVVDILLPTEPPNTHARLIFGGGSGPGTIATPLSELKATEDTTTLRVAKGWRDGIAGAGRLEYHDVMVPVWEWTPDN